MPEHGPRQTLAVCFHDLLEAGWTIDDVKHEYAQSALTHKAITEAIQLAKEALIHSAQVARAHC